MASFTPEQHGAIGDGIADDTAAIQAAINAAAAANGVLELAPITRYRISSTLTVQPQAGQALTFMQIRASGGQSMIHHVGSGPALKLIGLKYAQIEGLHIQLEQASAIGIAIDGDTAHVSCGMLTFADVLINCSTGGNQIGFSVARAALLNGLESAFVNYENCYVQARGRQYDDIGL